MRDVSVRVISVEMVCTDFFKVWPGTTGITFLFLFLIIDTLLVSCGYDLNVSLWSMHNHKLLSSLKVYHIHSAILIKQACCFL